MKLESISYRLGDRIISNDYLIDKIKSESSDLCSDELKQIIKQVKFYLNHAGAESRRWLTSEQHPIEMVLESFDEALKEANCEKTDIDLLLHVGMGRGFLEAGQSYFISKYLGINAPCFDIMDACNSWSRGMMVAYSFLNSGMYKKIAIVNTECNMLSGGPINPKLFQFSAFEDVAHKFAGLTLADGVSVTIVSKSDDEWGFKFVSIPDGADLCAIPVDGYQDYSLSSNLIGANGAGNFYCFAREMEKIGRENIKSLLDNIAAENPKFVFSHGHSHNIWEEVFLERSIPINNLRWNTFKKIGNLASACVPVGIKMAIEAGELKRGDTVMTCVPSGGMSLSSLKFTY